MGSRQWVLFVAVTALVLLFLPSSAFAFSCGIATYNGIAINACQSINITNTQGISTGANFQERVQVTPASGNLEAGNWILYDTATSNKLYGWAESSNVLWIKVPAGIGAGSSYNSIRIEYAKSGSFFSSGNGYSGEAPQLSPAYAEYDNGNDVFTQYWDFAGTGLPSGWSANTITTEVGHTGSYTVDNGLSVSDTNGVDVYANNCPGTSCVSSYDAEFVYSTSKVSGNFVIETAISSQAYTSQNYEDNTWWTKAGIMLQNTNSYGQGNGEAGAFVTTGEGNAFQWQLTSNYIAPDSNSNYCPTGPCWATYPTYLQVVSNTLGVSMFAGPDDINPTQVGSFVSPDGRASSQYFGFLVNSHASNSLAANTLTVAFENWIRVRSYPSGGVMPLATFGSFVSSAPTITLANAIAPDSIDLVIGSASDNALITATCATGDTCGIYDAAGTALVSGTGSVTLAYNALPAGYSSLYANDITAGLTGSTVTIRRISLNDQITVMLTNTQNSAVSANTPIMLTFNSLNYTSYVSNTLNNTAIAFSNGTVAYSWLEGNVLDEQSAANTLYLSDSVVYWFRSPQTAAFLPANTELAATNTVILGFGASTSSLLDGNFIGEAPQLSPTYGQYDNGNDVFGYYQRWGGLSSLPAGWTAENPSGTIITYASTYTRIAPSPTLGNWYGAYLTPLPGSLSSTPTMWDFYGNMYDTVTSGSAVGTSGTSGGSGQGYAFFEGNGVPSNNMIFLSADTQTAWASTGYSDTNTAKVYSMGMQSATSVNMLINYDPIYASTSVPSESPTYFIIEPSNNGGSVPSSPIYAYWLRSRSYPPNGVMPTATYGMNVGSCSASISAPSNSAIDVGQYETLTATESGCTSPYTYNILIVNSITPTTIAHSQLDNSDSATSNAFTFQLTSADASNSPEEANVIVNSAAASAYSSTFTINNALAFNSLTSDPSLPDTIETGNTITFTASVSGGTTPYTYNFIVANTATGAIVGNYLISTDSASNTFSWTIPSSVGANSLEANVVVTDHASSPETVNSVYSGTLTTTPAPESTFSASGLLYAVTGYSTGYIINTSTNTVVGSIPNINGRGTPFAIAISPDGKFGYVTDCASGGGGLEIISTVTNTVVGSIPFSYCPYGVAFSPSGTYAYATTLYGIEVISTTTNSIVRHIYSSTFDDPHGVAFSPSGKFAYVVNYFQGGLSVINTSVNAVVSTIDGFKSAVFISLNPSGTLAYVTTLPYFGGQSAVDVLSLTSNNIVKTITSGISDPYGVAVNPSGTAAYVANNNYGYDGNIAIINTATNSTVGAITSSDFSDLFGIAFASYSLSPSLSVQGWSASNSIVEGGQYQVLNATISGSTAPYTYNYLIYGPTGNLAYNALYPDVSSTANSFAFLQEAVPGAYTANVIVTDSANTPVMVSGSAAYTARNALVAGNIIPASPDIDSGRPITLKSTPTAGAPPYAYAWYASPSGNPGCNTANVISGQTSSTLPVSPATTNTYAYQVTDSATTNAVACSSPDTVTVHPALSITGLTASNTVIDANQYQALTASVSGGIAPYTYNFTVYNALGTAVYASSDTDSQLSNAILFQQAGAWGSGTFTANVEVTDNGLSSVAESTEYAANAPLSQVSFTISNSIGSPPQYETLNAVISGGSSPYTYNYMVYNAIGALMDSALYSSSATSNAFSFLLTDTSTWPSGAYTANVDEEDSASTNTHAQSSLNFVVCPAVTFDGSVSNSSIDENQLEVLTVNVIGCEGPYTYNYRVYNTGAMVYNSLFTTPQTLNSIAVDVNAAGPWAINVVVTDTGSLATYSKQFTFNAMTMPSVSISPASANIDSGQRFGMTAQASGGTSPYSYRWYQSTSGPVTCSPSDLIPDVVTPTYGTYPASNTEYAVNVTDSASTPEFACSTPANAVVMPRLSVSGIAPANPSYDLGSIITLTGTWTGGMPDYAANWSLFQYSSRMSGWQYAGSYVSNIITISTASLGAGTFNANLSVQDSASANAVAQSENDTLTVNNDPAITLTPNSTNVYGGGRVEFTAYVTNGTAPFTIRLMASNGTTLYTATGASEGDTTLGPITPALGMNTYNAVATDSAVSSYTFSSTSTSVYGSNSTTSTVTTTVTTIPQSNTGGIVSSTITTTATTTTVTSSATTAPATTTQNTTTLFTTVTTTVPQNMHENATLSGNRPVSLSFPAYNLTVTLESNASSSRNVSVSVSNMTEIAAPLNYTPMRTFNLNVSPSDGVTANVTFEYQCGSSAPVPFVLYNNTWEEVYNVVATSGQPCEISFSAPRNAVVGIFEKGQSTPVNPAAEAQSLSWYYVLAVVVIIVVVAIIVISMGKRRRGWR